MSPCSCSNACAGIEEMRARHGDPQESVHVAQASGWNMSLHSALPAGWQVVGEARAESWHRESRPRVDRAPLQAKLRWEAPAA